MVMHLFMSFVLINLLAATKAQDLTLDVLDPEAIGYPCNGTKTVIVSLHPQEEYQYGLIINLSEYNSLLKGALIEIKFEADATVELENNDFAKVYSYPDGRFTMRAYKDLPSAVRMQVKGTRGLTPNIKSIKVNGVVHCKHLIKDYFPFSLVKDSLSASSKIKSTPPVSNCGRRIINHNEPNNNAASTKSGSFPWQAGVFKLFSDKSTHKYFCGGTLVSKDFVVTAAHCVTQRGIPITPESFKINLGKYKLDSSTDGDVQELDVSEVIVHPEFERRNRYNDIALLRLASDAVFTDYVQPVCLWNSTDTEIDPLVGEEGTVVGWRLDETDSLTNELFQTNLLILSNSDCWSSLDFRSDIFRRDTTFCASFLIDSSICFGDKGSGMFVPKEMTSEGESSQTWFFRGVMSFSHLPSYAARCDPNHYAYFTNVPKYDNWIRFHVDTL